VAFDLEGERIGTIRIVPLGHGLTLTEQLRSQLDPSACAGRPGEWEVGRLVLAPRWRSDVEALRQCLYLSLEHACAEARVDVLYATCTHVLSRLYRRFGFSVLARDVPLAGTSKVYTLIAGDAGAVRRGLAGARTQ
jgi:hypothetical protein